MYYPVPAVNAPLHDAGIFATLRQHVPVPSVQLKLIVLPIVSLKSCFRTSKSKTKFLDEDRTGSTKPSYMTTIDESQCRPRIINDKLLQNDRRATMAKSVLKILRGPRRKQVLTQQFYSFIV